MLTKEFQRCLVEVILYALTLTLVSLLIVKLRWSDSLLYVFVIPCILSAYFFGRRVYLSMQALLVAAAVWVTSQVSGDFRASLISISAAGLSTIVVTEMIYRLAQARRRAEAALRASEERFRTVADFTYDWEYWIDPSGELLYVSPACERITGYRADEFLGQPDLLEDILHPGDQEMFREHLHTSAGRDEPLSIEFRILTREGDERWIGHICQPVYNVAGEWLGRRASNRDVTESQQVQQEIEKRRRYLEGVLAAAPDGIVTLDAEHRVVEWNPGAEKLFGYTADEVIDRNLDHLVTNPHVLEEAAGFTQTVMNKGRVGPVETVRYHRDGTPVDVILSGSPIVVEGELVGMVSIYTDISEHKRVERALRESRSRFLTVLDGIDAHIYVADLETYEILFMNERMRQDFGGDLTGEICWHVFRKDSGPCAHCTNDKLVGADGEPSGLCTWEGQNPLTGRWYMNYDRAIWWVDGRLARLEIATDITERVQAEKLLKEYSGRLEEMVEERTSELQAQYARLDAILRSTINGLVVTDAAGEILQANPVAQGWLDRFLSPEEVNQLQEAVRRVAAHIESQPVELLELKGLDLQLSGAPISVNGMPISARDDSQAVIAIHDVSHLRALDRMRTRFITNVSHELRTPITTIKLYVYLMQKYPDQWQEYLAPLAREADHQSRLVEDIVTISRIDAGRLELTVHPTPLAPLVERVIGSHQALAQSQGVTLERRVYGEDGGGMSIRAMVDRELVVQALSHLVENGIRYTLEGGRVHISIGMEKAGGRPWATLSVSDTGMGIAESELSHVFDRFFRGESVRAMQLTGNGLGLSIVKEIVELHGGQIRVESTEGEGTTFTMWMPISQD